MKRLKKTMVLVGIVTFLLNRSIVHALYEKTQPSAQPSYASNRLIVTFKSQQTPEKIRKHALRRKQLKTSGVVGFFQYQLETIKLRQQNQPLPEEREEVLTKIETDNKIRKYRNFVRSIPMVNNNEDDITYRTKIIESDGTIGIERVLEDYQKLPEVESITFDYIFHIQDHVTANDDFFSQMWSLKKLEIEKAWHISTGSNDVTVAIIDTGADYSHSDLNGHLLTGYNALAGGVGSAQDDNGHGTHVAGTIGGITNNQTGVAGINWNVSILPIKAMDAAGQGLLDVIVQGIIYAIDQAQSKNIRVINMSLGAPRFGPNGEDLCRSRFEPYIQQAIQKNITVVVAAGNSGQDRDPAKRDAGNWAPAGCNGVITVGATGPNDEKAVYSNSGNVITLSAPGGNEPRGTPLCQPPSCIISTWLGDNIYRVIQGTSMASPHVSGVVALMHAVNSNINPQEVRNILSNPVNLDPVSATDIGAGRINAYKALLAVGGSVNPTPTSTPIPQPTITAAPTEPPPPPVYSCTPQQLPQIIPQTGCSCQQGFCTSECQFYQPTIPLPPRLICSDNAGNYRDNYCLRPYRTAGDTNGDDMVELSDYFYFLRTAQSFIVPDGISGDLNGDGTIDNNDRELIIDTLKRICY